MNPVPRGKHRFGHGCSSEIDGFIVGGIDAETGKLLSNKAIVRPAQYDVPGICESSSK